MNSTTSCLCVVSEVSGAAVVNKPVASIETATVHYSGGGKMSKLSISNEFKL